MCSNRKSANEDGLATRDWGLIRGESSLFVRPTDFKDEGASMVVSVSRFASGTRELKELLETFLLAKLDSDLVVPEALSMEARARDARDSPRLTVAGAPI